MDELRRMLGDGNDGILVESCHLEDGSAVREVVEGAPKGSNIGVGCEADGVGQKATKHC